jgi:hypothetical protein
VFENDLVGFEIISEALKKLYHPENISFDPFEVTLSYYTDMSIKKYFPKLGIVGLTSEYFSDRQLHLLL